MWVLVGHALCMPSRADLLARFERWEAAQRVKREAADAARVARQAELLAERVGQREQLRGVWAASEPTPWDELTPEQQRALRQLRKAAGDPGVLDGAVAESALGGLLFPWQARAARRQAKVQRRLAEDD